jgi:hypothetical protein
MPVGGARYGRGRINNGTKQLLSTFDQFLRLGLGASRVAADVGGIWPEQEFLAHPVYSRDYPPLSKC